MMNISWFQQTRLQKPCYYFVTKICTKMLIEGQGIFWRRAVFTCFRLRANDILFAGAYHCGIKIATIQLTPHERASVSHSPPSSYIHGQENTLMCLDYHVLVSCKDVSLGMKANDCANRTTMRLIIVPNLCYVELHAIWFAKVVPSDFIGKYTYDVSF